MPMLITAIYSSLRTHTSFGLLEHVNQNPSVTNSDHPCTYNIPTRKKIIKLYENLIISLIYVGQSLTLDTVC